MPLLEAITIESDQVGIGESLLEDPVIRDVLSATCDFLSKTRDKIEANLTEVGQDPTLANFVFRGNYCLHCIDTAEYLQQEHNMDSKVLINETAAESKTKDNGFFVFSSGKKHVLLSVKDSNDSEVLIDPFYSQFLEDFGLSFDLASRIGDEKVFPKELLIAYKPSQIGELTEWVNGVAHTFWTRVAIGGLKGNQDRRIDVFTNPLEIPSGFLEALGVTFDTVTPATTEGVSDLVHRVWDRKNYRELSPGEINRIS